MQSSYRSTPAAVSSPSPSSSPLVSPAWPWSVQPFSWTPVLAPNPSTRPSAETTFTTGAFGANRRPPCSSLSRTTTQSNSTVNLKTLAQPSLSRNKPLLLHSSWLQWPTCRHQRQRRSWRWLSHPRQPNLQHGTSHLYCPPLALTTPFLSLFSLGS